MGDRPIPSRAAAASPAGRAPLARARPRPSGLALALWALALPAAANGPGSSGAALAAGGVADQADQAEMIDKVDKVAVAEVWVDLVSPPIAAGGAIDELARQRLWQQLETEQDAVAERLRQLGGVERARVKIVRNALAFDLPVTALEAARRLPGVRQVQVVRHRMRIDGPGS